jgi:hypothetical protein
MSVVTETIEGIRAYTSTADTSIDYELLHQGVYAIEGFVSIVLGFVLTAIFLTLGLIVALDILYLFNPTFSYYADTKNSKVFNTLVSKVARESRKISLTTGQVAIWIYLKKRAVFLACFGITLFILYGNFTVVVHIVSYAVQQFIGAVQWKVANPTMPITETTTTTIITR